MPIKKKHFPDQMNRWCQRNHQNQRQISSVPSAAGETVAGGGTVATALYNVVGKKKEHESFTPALPMHSTPSKPSDKSVMDAVLDDLIDTLG